MRGARLIGSLALGLTMLSPAVAAQDKPAEETGEEKGKIRRDPEGRTGISPYMEDVATGRAAFVEGKVAAAIAAFDSAIGKDDKRQLAYLLKAQAELASGDLDAATKTCGLAEQKRAISREMSKTLFFCAEAKEEKTDSPSGSDNEPGPALDKLKAKWEEVKGAWKRYVDFIEGKDDVVSFRASADERRGKIDARVKRDIDFAAVKKRVLDRAAVPAPKKK